MRNTPTQLPGAPIGVHPFVDWCRKVIATLRERTVLAGPGIGISYEQKGTRIWVKPDLGKTSKAVKIRRLVIVEVGDDTLECGEVGSSTISVTVAKDYKLQRTPWDGGTFPVPRIDTAGVETAVLVTYTYFSEIARRASDGSNEETQTIVPPYILENDVIFAIQVEDTGIEGVTWQELSNGRAWARVA